MGVLINGAMGALIIFLMSNSLVFEAIFDSMIRIAWEKEQKG